MANTFSGFPAAGIEFLRNLKENNDRDWFRERKEIYEQQVKLPMSLLAEEAAAACRKRGLAIFAKDKNPVTRIYRDIRFSSDKRPFHTYIGAGLKSAAARATHGELYIHISPDESFLAAGFWMPERPFLRAWREEMTRNEAPMLRMVKSLLKKKLSLSREYTLRRLPRGYDQHAHGALADFLRLTSFVTSRKLNKAEYGSTRFVATVAEFGLAAKPLLEYGWNLTYQPPRDILDER